MQIPFRCKVGLHDWEVVESEWNTNLLDVLRREYENRYPGDGSIVVRSNKFGSLKELRHKICLTCGHEINEIKMHHERYRLIIERGLERRKQAVELSKIEKKVMKGPEKPKPLEPRIVEEGF